MKKLLAILLIVSTAICLSSCAKIKDEKIGSAVAENKSVVSNLDENAEETKEKEFVVGEKVKFDFTLPTKLFAKSGHFNLKETNHYEMNLNDITLTKEKINDISNYDDYPLYTYHSFYKYNYKIHLSGSISNFDMRSILINIFSDDGEIEFLSFTDEGYCEGGMGTPEVPGKTINSQIIIVPNSDGSFDCEFDGYSNSNINTFSICDARVEV